MAKQKERLDRVTIRFAGDSGDGIQVTGGQFTSSSAIAGNDLATLPDFPAEIRAPAGTLAGVSGFQVQFSSTDVYTPGDYADVLVTFNPAALKVNLKDLDPNAVIIANEDEFTETELRKAGYDKNPLYDQSLARFRVFRVPITTLTIKALEGVNMSNKDKERCKNFFALGMMYWLYSRPMEPTLKWIRQRFSKRPEVVEANIRSIKAGYSYAESTEIFQSTYEVPPARLEPGRYRNITGNEALALGFITSSEKSGLPLFYASYPITPASEILQELSIHKNFRVITFQAEDEIAAVTAAVGAAFAGSLAVTGTSGPGLVLKSEGINLAVMTELPLVIVDVQRAGPSTGLPTKTEQGDLLQAVFGRNSDSPVCVLAASSPADCFDMAITACRIAIKYMTPVYLLSDGFLAFGTEPWKIPDIDKIPSIEVKLTTQPETFQPYQRDERTLARPWALPGTANLEHRIGGLEKSHIYGRVSYDPANHDLMVKLKANKIARVVQDIPDIEVYGPKDAKLLVLGWGSTLGHIRLAVELCQSKGLPVARAHLRYLNPFPSNLGKVLSRFQRVLVPEINLGQLKMLLRARYLVDISGFNKIAGQPFKTYEIVDAIEKEFESM